VCQTHIVGAGREQALVDAMVTEVTLLRDLIMIVKINGIVGTSLNTSLTPRAFGIIQNDDAVRSFGDGFIGTGIRAGRVITMTTHIYPKNEIQGIIDHTRPVFANINEFDTI